MCKSFKSNYRQQVFDDELRRIRAKMCLVCVIKLYFVRTEQHRKTFKVFYNKFYKHQEKFKFKKKTRLT